jgi:two component transcriptional regulator, winged helix family
MDNILVIEDEKNIQDMIHVYLRTKKYKVLQAFDYVEALDILVSKKNIDLVLLDWMIPKGDGLKLIKEIKQNSRRKRTPVIMISAKANVDNRIEGLNAGADDYLTKPFSLKELLARIEANLRRIKNQKDHDLVIKDVIEYEGIRIDNVAHRVFIDNQDVKVRRIEYKLLNFLVSHPDRVFSRTQLLDNVWGLDTYVDERTVDVSIGRLKRILAPSGRSKFLQTVRGEGYRLSNIVSH